MAALHGAPWSNLSSVVLRFRRAVGFDGYGFVRSGRVRLYVRCSVVETVDGHRVPPAVWPSLVGARVAVAGVVEDRQGPRAVSAVLMGLRFDALPPPSLSEADGSVQHAAPAAVSGGAVADGRPRPAAVNFGPACARRSPCAPPQTFFPRRVFATRSVKPVTASVGTSRASGSPCGGAAWWRPRAISRRLCVFSMTGRTDVARPRGPTAAFSSFYLRVSRASCGAVPRGRGVSPARGRAGRLFSRFAVGVSVSGMCCSMFWVIGLADRTSLRRSASLGGFDSCCTVAGLCPRAFKFCRR